MKNTILAIILLFTSINVFYSQTNIYPSTGNVGIGTVSPKVPLHIENNGIESNGILLKLANNSNNFAYSGIDGLGFYLEQVADTPNKSQIRLQARNSNQGNYAQLFIDGANSRFNLINGNVGIGTFTPTEKLEIGGNAYLNIKIGQWATIGTTGGGLATIIGNNVKASQTVNNKMEYITSTVDGAKAIKLQYNEGITFHTMLGTVNANETFSNFERMRIDNNGNVGIGTTNPTSKLTVAGNINSREVKVSVDAGADFVFDKDYALPSLQEVEKFVTKNKHLPEIASAKEMQKEGINLSEMNIKLLQKIEELTLYVIEQEKRLKNQHDQIEKNNKTVEMQHKTLQNQQKIIETLAERLNLLETK
ncbi:hypothetical protein FVB9288_02246 [Flavobacterium sp. CECT 9288]|uniref:tail fiber protein n=1 Tax=Flavobacterium sp. CECT 9288 TaxID=2845819 RepID=UPI001E3F119C|nr:tail fiber protein [Flavobacterium sp. CECT 9288]CAH0336540.1 hypothetical protein FVB9288_02246 [Flavobacterium sp. CECT 9288]